MSRDERSSREERPGRGRSGWSLFGRFEALELGAAGSQDGIDGTGAVERCQGSFAVAEAIFGDAEVVGDLGAVCDGKRKVLVEAFETGGGVPHDTEVVGIEAGLRPETILHPGGEGMAGTEFSDDTVGFVDTVLTAESTEQGIEDVEVVLGIAGSRDKDIRGRTVTCDDGAQGRP